MFTNPRPLKVDVPQAEVQRLMAKVRDTRMPGRGIVPDAADKYGPTYEWVEGLLEAWKSFEWNAAQEKMNRVPHFIAEIEDLNIHFVHTRAKQGKGGIPLLMEPLSNPASPNDIAFNVVVSSYENYVVQAGDWGQFVARELGTQYPDSCKLRHLNFAPSPLPQGAKLTKRERDVQDRVDDWVENHIGYAVCMRTRPHTIGFAFHDSPIGILMWVGEKYNEAADPATQCKPFWTEAILTQACLYFFSGCIMPSMLTYFENERHHMFAAYAMKPENHIQVPFGYTSFFWDTEPSSKRAVEKTGNLVFYKERDDGGHFAALEHPVGICEDLRELVMGHWDF